MSTYEQLVQAQARVKTYTAPVILVMFLYGFAYFPGLIANILYLREARRMEDLADADLPGVGCLTALLGIGILILLFWIAAGVLVLFPLFQRLRI